MNFRRAAGIIAAGALALGVSAGVAGTGQAQASVTPAVRGVIHPALQIPENTFVEVWMPYITPNRPHCLDVITSGVIRNQIYNCHASDGHGDNQLWELINLGGGSYWLVNKYFGGRCLTATSTLNVSVFSCTADASQKWHVVPSAYDPNGFELSNDQWGQCLSADGIPPSNGSGKIRLFGCSNPPVFNGDVQIQTWAFG